LPHLGPWDSPAEADRAAVDIALGQADVKHLAARSATTLSGGELTRALLARLLAGDPKIMLADEPVAGLDPAHRIQVLAFLRDIAKRGRTVIVVLHDLTLAARFCDRLILMNSGKVAADGAPRDVLIPDLLASAYGVNAAFLEYDGQMVIVPWATTR
jgi:iron complex transport system ATP-binding protein